MSWEETQFETDEEARADYYRDQEQRRKIAFDVVFADIGGGDAMVGLFLSQIIFWEGNKDNGQPRKIVRHDKKLWIAKHPKGWWEECRLGPGQVSHAIKVLEGNDAHFKPPFPIIERHIYRFNGTPMTHIRLLWRNFRVAQARVLQGTWPKRVEKRGRFPKASESEDQSSVIIPEWHEHDFDYAEVLERRLNGDDESVKWTSKSFDSPLPKDLEVHCQNFNESLTESTTEKTTKKKDIPLASLAGASPLRSDAVSPTSDSGPGQASGNGHALEDARGEGVGGEGRSPSTPPIAAAAPPSAQMAGGRAVGGDGHAPVSGDEADSPILPKGNPNGFGHMTADLANYWWQFVGRLPNESEFRATRKTMRELLALDAKGKPVAGRKGYAPDEIKACIDGFRECGVVNENAMMIGWHIEAFLKDDKPWPPSGARPRTQRLPAWKRKEQAELAEMSRRF